MTEAESHKASLLGGSAVEDEPAVTTHLRALGITSSGIIRGAVQFGSMQVSLYVLPFFTIMQLQLTPPPGLVAHANEPHVPADRGAHAWSLHHNLRSQQIL